MFTYKSKLSKPAVLVGFVAAMSVAPSAWAVDLGPVHVDTNGSGNGNGVHANVGVGGGSGVNANVGVGGGDGVNADATVGGGNGVNADVNAGGGSGVNADVNIGGSGGSGGGSGDGGGTGAVGSGNSGGGSGGSGSTPAEIGQSQLDRLAQLLRSGEWRQASVQLASYRLAVRIIYLDRWLNRPAKSRLSAFISRHTGEIYGMRQDIAQGALSEALRGRLSINRIVAVDLRHRTIYVYVL